MNNQERRDTRIREISQEIIRLSEELQQILRIEPADRPDTERPTPQVNNGLQEGNFRIGDRVQIIFFIGRFGATRGSTGTVTAVEEEYIYFRLDMNRATVHRHKRNLRVIHRVEGNVVEQ